MRLIRARSLEGSFIDYRGIGDAAIYSDTVDGRADRLRGRRVTECLQEERQIFSSLESNQTPDHR